MRIAVLLTSSHHLPQFAAPRSLVPRLVRGSFRGRERGDLEGAQYRLPVLAAHSPNLGNSGA
jgi:hypothetical protein